MTTPGRDVQLRYGYTMGDVESLARLAAATSFARTAGGYQDRYEESYGAIAERLYAEGDPPTKQDLIIAARAALSTASTRNESFRGVSGGEFGVAPKFVGYWEFTRVTRSCETRVVEGMAVSQILPMVPPRGRQAIYALAVHGDHATAAAALGWSLDRYYSYLSVGRRVFRSWWHQGEVPSSPWGSDRRIHSRGVMHTLRSRKSLAASKGATR